MQINLEGAIPILGGIFVWLAATGRFNPSKDPTKGAAWRRQWGPRIKLLAPIVILFGVLQLFGMF